MTLVIEVFWRILIRGSPFRDYVEKLIVQEDIWSINKKGNLPG